MDSDENVSEAKEMSDRMVSKELVVSGVDNLFLGQLEVFKNFGMKIEVVFIVDDCE